MEAKENINEIQIRAREVMESFEVTDAYKLLSGRIQEEIDKLPHAYKVKGEEAAELSGLYRGLDFFFLLIDAYKREGVAAKDKKDLINFRKDNSTEEPKQL